MMHYGRKNVSQRDYNPVLRPLYWSRRNELQPIIEFKSIIHTNGHNPQFSGTAYKMQNGDIVIPSEETATVAGHIIHEHTKPQSDGRKGQTYVVPPHGGTPFKVPIGRTKPLGMTTGMTIEHQDYDA